MAEHILLTNFHIKGLKPIDIRGLWLIWMMCFCVFATVIPSHSPQAQYLEEEDIPNEFIFNVVLPPVWTISEALFAYEKSGKYYLPISELAGGLDFFIETELDRGFARGIAGSEDYGFTIDYDRRELILNGERQAIDDEAVLQSDFLATDDIYVQLELLNRIWPVEMNVDLSALQIIIEAEQDLPFMLKLEREQNRTQLLSKKAEQKAGNELLPRKSNDYKLLGKPAIDYQAIYTFDDLNDEINASNIFSGVQQVGGLLADYSANFRIINREFERPDNIRLRFTRKTAGEEYIVPGVRNVALGDINLNQRDLIGNTESGRGLFISNDNRDRFREFDRTTIEGVGPPGWEVEIYNNDELVDFGVIPDDGRYLFEDVVLNFGNNQIKILLFGPQGQVREEFRTFRAGGSMLSPGQFRYQAGLLDADRAFILLDNDPRTQPRGVVKNLGASYGVNRWLTVFGNYAELPELDKDRSYLSAGGVVSTKIGLVEVEGYSEVAGGKAAKADFITSFLGTRANFGVAWYNDFESQDAGFGNNQKTFETTAQLNRTVRIGALPFGLRLNTIHTERKTGLPVTTLDFAQTFSRAGMRLTHNFSTRLNDYAHESTNAGLTATMREGPWQLRGNLNYRLHPQRELDSFNSELRYKLDNSFQAAFTNGYSFQTDAYNAGVQLGYEFDKVLGTVETNYTRGAGWDFTLRASSSLSPYSEDGGYEFSSERRRDFSPVRARVFLDNDYDGKFTEGDEPLEDVKIRIGRGASQESTNENGAILANAPADQLLNFKVDKTSLIDPYFIPATEGFSAVPARGSVLEADFPIIESGAIEGTVFRAGSDRAVPGLTIELVDDQGDVSAQVVSAFDGYYAFEFVAPGTYTVRTGDTHQVDLLDNTVTIGGEDLFVYGNDLFLDVPVQVASVSAVPVDGEMFGPALPVAQEEGEPTNMNADEPIILTPDNIQEVAKEFIPE